MATSEKPTIEEMNCIIEVVYRKLYFLSEILQFTYLDSLDQEVVVGLGSIIESEVKDLKKVIGIGNFLADDKPHVSKPENEG